MSWHDDVLLAIQRKAPQIPKQVAAAILKAKYPNDESKSVVEKAVEQVIEAYLLDDVPAPRQTPCVIYSRPSLYGFASSGIPVAAVWSTVSEAIPASTNFPENFRYREVYGVDTLTRHPSG
jgi:hypothetical protein